MGASNKTSHAHGITTKVAPLFFVFIALIYLFPERWTGFLQVFPLENLFLFLGVFLPGLVVIYEGLNIRKDKGETGAIVSAIMFFIIGGLLIITSFLILFDLYDPRTDTTDFLFVFSIAYGAGFLILVFGTLWEIYKSERYLPHKKFPIPLSH